MTYNVLVVVVHSDDEAIGMKDSIKKYVNRGDS